MTTWKKTKYALGCVAGIRQIGGIEAALKSIFRFGTSWLEKALRRALVGNRLASLLNIVPTCEANLSKTPRLGKAFIPFVKNETKKSGGKEQRKAKA